MGKRKINGRRKKDVISRFQTDDIDVNSILSEDEDCRLRQLILAEELLDKDYTPETVVEIMGATKSDDKEITKRQIYYVKQLAKDGIEPDETLQVLAYLEPDNKDMYWNKVDALACFHESGDSCYMLPVLKEMSSEDETIETQMVQFARKINFRCDKWRLSEMLKAVKSGNDVVRERQIELAEELLCDKDGIGKGLNSRTIIAMLEETKSFDSELNLNQINLLKELLNNSSAD